MARKYPIGLQSFREIRERGYVYIDKTEAIHRLVETGKYYFLSRPRRFGKSLLVETIEELFRGSRELFKGLWVENHWNWEDSNPIIHFNFADMGVTELGLRPAIVKGLDENARRLNITLTDSSIDQQFKELIEKASLNGKVVILIDEYDKPLIDYLDDQAKVSVHRNILKSFYSILKGRDENIRLFLLTGVSRFSKVSIFSDLNHLRDISMNGQFDDLAGITQQELERNFIQEITELQQKDKDILIKIKNWYNGYTWGRVNKVYNPFSILNFMADYEFNNYWFQTGTPTFFYDMIRRNPGLDFPVGEVEAGPEALVDLFNQSTEYNGPDSIRPVTIMFQTGYLTVKDYNPEDRIYTLDFPNLEVKESMEVFLLGAYSYQPMDTVRPNVLKIARAFRSNDIALVMKLIDILFVQIPSTLWKGAKEQMYHAIIQNTFGLLDILMESERNYAGIRPDITVFTKTHIYVLECKLDQSADAALNQIVERDYFRPFQADNRKKVAVGINFSSEKKAIEDYLVKELE